MEFSTSPEKTHVSAADYKYYRIRFPLTETEKAAFKNFKEDKAFADISSKKTRRKKTRTFPLLHLCYVHTQSRPVESDLRNLHPASNPLTFFLSKGSNLSFRAKLRLSSLINYGMPLHAMSQIPSGISRHTKWWLGNVLQVLVRLNEPRSDVERLNRGRLHMTFDMTYSTVRCEQLCDK